MPARWSSHPEGKPRRIRLAPIADFSGATLKPFVVAVAAAGARVVTSDGWSGSNGLPDHVHEPKVVGKMAAHIILRWTHRVFSNLKRWALGTYHGLPMASVASTSGVTSTSSSLGWNRRRHTAVAFDTLLGLGARLAPATARDFVEQRV